MASTYNNLGIQLMATGENTDVKVDIVTLPTEDVAESPVSGTPIPITTDPTEEVAESPVG